MSIEKTSERLNCDEIIKKTNIIGEFCTYPIGNSFETKLQTIEEKSLVSIKINGAVETISLKGDSVEDNIENIFEQMKSAEEIIVNYSGLSSEQRMFNLDEKRFKYNKEKELFEQTEGDFNVKRESDEAKIRTAILLKLKN